MIGSDPVIDDWLIILDGLRAQTGQESNGLILIFSVSNRVPRREAGTLNQKKKNRGGGLGETGPCIIQAVLTNHIRKMALNDSLVSTCSSGIIGGRTQFVGAGN